MQHGEVQNAIRTAIDVGYRHFDGAFIYKNEKEIGEAYRAKIEDGTVKREDLFITTKLWAAFQRPERVEYGLRLSLQALQLDYIDLYLIHTPTAVQYKGDDDVFPRGENNEPLFDDISPTETWKAMERLVQKGLTKSIGVSNFNIQQTKAILEVAKVPIATNQIENHPYLDQSQLINFCKSENILITSHSPLGSPDKPRNCNSDTNLLEDPLVKEIAEAKGCSPAQVLIAYHLCQGFLCIPKSVRPSRIQQNFQVSNFGKCCVNVDTKV
ncbi:Alcohol dehydrogenase [NADP(+)] A [Holothuria leucospilota]|uniref:Alcohol dehydrogenase [NADP(+)] A n=1 Tax=Holothuria leucospilota TaxID=206669 RepID=A0A9Q1H446_HOLLE|nr:Alcohol dehydrogenase [NADP(+)] A [Holothuria leucospilota]